MQRRRPHLATDAKWRRTSPRQRFSPNSRRTRNCAEHRFRTRHGPGYYDTRNPGQTAAPGNRLPALSFQDTRCSFPNNATPFGVSRVPFGDTAASFLVSHGTFPVSPGSFPMIATSFPVSRAAFPRIEGAFLRAEASFPMNGASFPVAEYSHGAGADPFLPVNRSFPMEWCEDAGNQSRPAGNGTAEARRWRAWNLPRRGKVVQPGVARHELPWEHDANDSSTPTGLPQIVRRRTCAPGGNGY